MQRLGASDGASDPRGFGRLAVGCDLLGDLDGRCVMTSERPIQCSECERRFKDEHGLRQHMADFHKRGKRPRETERYPIYIDDADIQAEYEPHQFACNPSEEDF